ncbi:hypothetical protein ACJJTC_014365 [Scirpophaga incertulas]
MHILEVVSQKLKKVRKFRGFTSTTKFAQVFRGIEAAQADLERENAERLWQEGLLRRVPVVGRVVGWWAPAAPPPPPPGRRLHLAHGTLQSTHDLYRVVQNKKEEAAEELARAHSPSRPEQSAQ